MKVRTNKGLIANRQRIGRWSAFAGLLILVAGLIVSFRAQQTQSMVAVAYGTLIVGMLLSSIGIYLADKWIQKPRADQALESVTKGFDDRYYLYNYVLPADHVLASPYGLMVFTVKRQNDTVRYVDGDWKHEQGILKRLQSLSRERLGDPIAEMERDIEGMEELLEQHLPGADIPVDGTIVFTHPDVVLETDGAPADVLHVKKLKDYIRRADRRGGRINNELLRKLGDTLDRIAAQDGADLEE